MAAANYAGGCKNNDVLPSLEPPRSDKNHFLVARAKYGQNILDFGALFIDALQRLCPACFRARFLFHAGVYGSSRHGLAFIENELL